MLPRSGFKNTFSKVLLAAPRMARHRLLESQAFWVAAALLVVLIVVRIFGPSFFSAENLHNEGRNAAFIGLMTLGQTAVIITGGIDVSVGSVMGLAGVVTALTLEGGAGPWTGIAAGLLAALLCGFINAFCIAKMRLSPFVTTLAMLGIARSIAMVLSNNKMVVDFGPDGDRFFDLTGSEVFSISTPLLIWLILTILFALLFKHTVWGRHLFAVGGNETAASRVGVNVSATKFCAYLISSLTAGLSAVLSVGWLGSVSSALGTGYELTVVAAAVLGGASLTGGQGSAWGALVGAFFIEVIRNGLVMAGVDPYWQGTVIGVLIVFAAFLGNRRRES